MKIKIAFIVVLALICYEGKSQILKWDTLNTQFKVFQRELFYTKNESKNYTYSYEQGSKQSNFFVLSRYGFLKKDLSESIHFLLETKYNPKEYRDLDAFMTDDKIIHVVADSGYLFQRYIYDDYWTSKKIIDSSAFLFNIAFRDSLYGIVTNIKDIQNIKPELYFTEDGGESWTKMNNQIENDKQCAIIDIDFFNDTLIVITYEYETKNRTIYLSFDSGASWEHISTFPNFSNFDRSNQVHFKNSKLWVVSPRYNEFVYSDNFGVTWLNITPNYEGGGAITKLNFKNDMSEVFAMNAQGVFHSFDGLNWEFDQHHDYMQLSRNNLMMYKHNDEIYLIQDSAALKYVGLNTSIEHFEPEDSKIIIYPNPAREFITFSDYKFGTNYTIVDLQGHKVQSSQIVSDKIDISDLELGTYIIKFEGFDKPIKFIKM